MKKLSFIALSVLLILCCITAAAEYTNDAQSMTQLINNVCTGMTLNEAKVYVVGEYHIVNYEPIDGFVDETDAIRKGISNYINYAREAYQLDGVQSITANMYLTMIDTKGNKEKVQALRIAMGKEYFESFKWENLENKSVPIFSEFMNNCYDFSIHPGIWKRVNEEEIYYIK